MSFTTPCASLGVEAVRADDRAYVDDLCANVAVYMHGCGVGVAVFDETAPSIFNPNVALEVGYMCALGRRVCLLKDSRIAALPVDLVARLYRPFDPAQVAATLGDSLAAWLRDNDFDTPPPILADSLTANSFKTYMRWRFPHEQLFEDQAHFDRHFRALLMHHYNTLSDVAALLSRTERAREYLFRGQRSDFALCHIAHAIGLAHDDHLSQPRWYIGTIEEIRKARALL